MGKPLPLQDIVFAWEDQNKIGNAVLKMPAHHELAKSLYAESQALITQRAHSLQWGEIGPDLLTRVARQSNVASEALPPSSFYPLHYSEADAVLRPERTADIETMVAGSVLAHLWHEMLRRNGAAADAYPPAGSFLDMMCRKHGVVSNARPARARQSISTPLEHPAATRDRPATNEDATLAAGEPPPDLNVLGGLRTSITKEHTIMIWRLAKTPLRPIVQWLRRRLLFAERGRLAALEAERGRLAALETAVAVLQDMAKAAETARQAMSEEYARRETSEEFARQAMSERLTKLERAHGEQQLLNQIRSTMDWIAVAPLAKSPLISVVMPTRNRRALLPRAIASVQAQSYANWELLIVDDASTDDTAGFLASLNHNSLRFLSGPGKGVCAARNVALSSARGDLIAYLDDDNIMHQHWLKSVAWGFEQWPQFDVLYGAFVLDNSERVRRVGDELPALIFHSYDHHSLPLGNIADMSAIAHRTGLPEGRFDETLIGLGDWDLLLRLTRSKPPLTLPAIACFYTSDAADRLSVGPSFNIETPIIQEKNRR